jgi:hypothetical protein
VHVKFDAFETLAEKLWQQVPAEYKQGVDHLEIERDARVHPDRDEVYTLGECITEDFPSDYGGPETTRSAVVLYYGSFLRLAQDDPDFDWERELWETLTHELQHHLEALASEDALEDFDYAVEENFKRQNGEPFDPLFFRAGEVIVPDRYRVEQDIFIEVNRADHPDRQWIGFEWEGMQYRLPRPQAQADVSFVRVNGGPDLGDGELWIVLVARRSVLQVLRSALGNAPLQVSETEMVAELIA